MNTKNNEDDEIRQPICVALDTVHNRVKELARRLDGHDLEQQRATASSGVRERIMVAINAHNPNAATLLRKAARLATRLRAPWYVVAIQSPRENLQRVNPTIQGQVTSTLKLARDLGGIALMPFHSANITGVVAALVEEYGISHIILARTSCRWYQRWFGGTVLDRILRSIPNVDVLVVDCA